MCYLIAKRFEEHGCYAVRMKHGKHLVDFKSSLNKAVGLGSGIQLVTISRPMAFGEYAPYSYVQTEEEFTDIVLKMNQKAK